LFYSLLSPLQRRQIGIGSPAFNADIGTGWGEYFFGKLNSNPYRDWPKQICLLSRQWITTVQDLMPNHDIRESVALEELPGGQASEDYWKNLQPEIYNHRKLNCAVPVAGTWYLGVLNGGNIDLAPQVMKAVLSREHEEKRLLNRSGAPVSKSFYELPKANGETVAGNADSPAYEHQLPYGNLVAIKCSNDAKNQAALFKECDFINLHSPGNKLACHADPVSAHVWEKLSEETQQMLNDRRAAGFDPRPLQAALAKDLNEWVQKGLVYDPKRFNDVELRPTTQHLYQKYLTGASEVSFLLNRLLLEDAFPDEIARNFSPMPFERSQIHSYLQVSPILFLLVRDVMKIQIKNELCLSLKYCEGNPEKMSQRQQVVAEIQGRVNSCFNKLRELCKY
jgi:hypothetical protein